MAIEFTLVEAALDNIRGLIINNREAFTQAVARIGAANNAIGNLGTTYAAIVTEINARAAADPTDTGWKVAKARLDKFVAEYQALKAVLQAAVDALAAL